MAVQAERTRAIWVALLSRRVLGRALFVLLVLWAAGWGAYRLTVPHYKGNSLGFWFDAYRSSQAHERNEAVTAFRAMGPDAVSYLIKELNEEPLTMAVWYHSLKATIFGRGRGYDRSDWLHRKELACDILGEMGPVARPAVPHLEAATSNSIWYVSISARAALIRIRGESPVPFIEELRDTSDPIAWYPRAMLVSDLGTAAAPAVPLLLRALQHSNDIVISHALVALGRIQSSPELCVPAIRPFLTNGSVSMRQKAFHAILHFPQHAPGVADAIISGLSNSYPWIRSQSLGAVKEVLPPADQRRALPACEALLNDPNPYVRQVAKRELPAIRAAAK